MRFSHGVYRPDLISPYFTLCTFSFFLYATHRTHKKLIRLCTKSLDNHRPMKTNRCKKRTWQIQIYHTRDYAAYGAIFCPAGGKGRAGGWVAERASLSAGVHTHEKERESVCSQQGVSPCNSMYCLLTHTLTPHPPTPRLLGRARNRRY
jgi:hypothetical protein